MTSPRLLVVPGLGDSGPAHWQSWLEARHPGAVRVRQRDWQRPALDDWAAAIGETLAREPANPRWLVAAHSFGCLALLRHLALEPTSPVVAALLVAPADPARFAGVPALLPDRPPPIALTWVSSTNDPWMRFERSLEWSQRWGCRWKCLGAAGHINVDSGHGPLPLAESWLADAAREVREGAPPRTSTVAA